jgi:hypothetical protein
MVKVIACVRPSPALHPPQVFNMGDIQPNKVADPEARAALVWILGQFGKHIESRSRRQLALGCDWT